MVENYSNFTNVGKVVADSYNGHVLGDACEKEVVTTLDASASLPTSGAVKTVTDTINTAIGDDATSGTICGRIKILEDTTGGMTLVFTNVSASSWVADATYSDYGYRCAIALTGVRASDVPCVNFALTESKSGNYAPICDTYTGGVYIYGTTDTSITIPSIVITKVAVASRLTVTITDSAGEGGEVGRLVTATNGTDTVTGTTGSDGSVTLVLNDTGVYTITSDAPSGGSVGSTTVTAEAGGTYTASLTITYGFGVVFCCIDESNSDCNARVTYPASVEINSKTYTNTAPAVCASGHNLNGWASHKLIEGIKPVYYDGSTFTDATKASSVSWDTTLDAYSEFPFRWLGFYKTGELVYVLFSDDEENPDDDVFQDYAFLNNSNARQSAFHVGCFPASGTGSSISSKVGTSPTVSRSITDFIADATAKGDDYDIITYYQAMYLTALFTILYKSTNCQTALGYGYVGGSAVQSNTGIAFDNDYGMAGSSSTTERMCFFWIHDMWGNVLNFVGSAHSDSSYKLETNVGQRSSVSSWNKSTGQGPSSDVSGYLSKTTGTKDSCFFPLVTDGSSSTYYADYSYVSSSYFPGWGGNGGYGDYAGCFLWYFNSASAIGASIGSRLSLKKGE